MSNLFNVPERFVITPPVEGGESFWQLNDFKENQNLASIYKSVRGAESFLSCLKAQLDWELNASPIEKYIGMGMKLAISLTEEKAKLMTTKFTPNQQDIEVDYKEAIACVSIGGKYGNRLCEWERFDYMYNSVIRRQGWQSAGMPQGWTYYRMIQ